MSDHPNRADNLPPDLEPSLRAIFTDLMEVERSIEEARVCLQQAILHGDRP
jgi:hypothetical protein